MASFCGPLAATSTRQLTPIVPSGYDPVVNVNVHTDGRYAFVELRTPDMASASLQLNGQVGPDFNQVHF